jgi:anti-sigma regulatory factor (Ser/Thr protein kinase)
VHEQTTDGFCHEALFYADEDAFLAGTVPFVREAVSDGAPVLAALGPKRSVLLRGELGADAEHVSFADIESMGRNPARIIPLWRAFVDDHSDAGARLRGIGEPAWGGRTAAELGECARHEALLNLAFGGDRGWDLLCPYDTTALDEETLRTAHRTHPLVGDGDQRHTCRDYDASMPTQVFHGALPEPAGPIDQLSFGRTELRDVRSLVSGCAERAGMDAGATGDITLAASELAANSIRYGDGGGSVRVWREPEMLVCEIRDAGRIHDLMAGRVRPRVDDIGGRGLWLVNHLCDLVQIRSSGQGTTVRVHSRISGSRA